MPITNGRVTRKGISRLLAIGTAAGVSKRLLTFRAAILGLISAALTASLLVSTWAPASADPPLTVEDAKAQIAALQTDAEALDQQYVGIKEELDRGRKKLELKKADAATQRTKVSRMKKQVGQVALARFQNRNLDAAAQLFFTTDADGFLSQISTVEKVSENQNSVLQDYLQQQADLADIKDSTEADVAVLEEQEKELKTLRTASEKKISQSKAVLARLSAEERRRIADEKRKAAGEARKQAEKANNSTSTRSSQKSSSRSTTRESTPVATGSGRGATALAFARAQLGKPYQYASAGPNSYDCSGLTYASWKAAGVTLPRTSQAQYGVGRAVSKSELALGDVVFFYSGLSHVALYAGNGMVIHAPHPGSSVEYIKMSYMPYAGARRPG